MLHKCAVGGCPNRSDTIIHYILPEDPKRRSAWIKFMEDAKANGENVSSLCRVCGDHFSEDCYFKMDLGYTICKILSVDAVPTIHSVNRSCEKVNSIQNEETDDTCAITIAETISLACVKEEPLEFDLNCSMTPQDDQNSSLEDSVKCEESELSITEDMDIKNPDQGQDVKVKKVKKGGRLRSFNCLACGQKFRGRGALMQHQREKHVKQKSESVTQENKIIVRSTPAEKLPKMGLSMQHSATHTAIDTEGNSDKKHLCDQCGKRFAYESFLKAHQKVHEYGESILPYVCHLCPRRFGYKVALVAHLRQHVRKTGSPCPVCEKSFPSKSFLAQHIKASHATKKLFCKTCNGSFKLNGYMKHMDMHNKVTPYYCEICKIYFTQKDHPGHMLIHEKNSVSEEPVVSSKNIPRRGRKKRACVSEQHNNSEEGSAPGIGSDSEPVTVRQEEAEMELSGEANILDKSLADPSEGGGI